MSRFELYSEGLRVDGRRFDELRHFSCRLGTHAKAADGSSLVEMGTSQVVATVSGPQEPSSRSKMDTAKATLTVNIVVAAFSSTNRIKHTSNERPIQELAMNLKETFEAAVITSFAPRTEIVVNLNVLAQDGNILPACANAMCLALIDAGVPMYEYVSSVAVAVHQDVPLVDPNQIEAVELPNLAVGVIGKSSMVSLLVLEKRLLMDCLESALNLGISGCQIVREMMDEEVRRSLSRGVNGDRI